MNFVEVQWIEHPLFLVYGLLIGIMLGFLLQKGRLASFSVIIGQFLLRDFTMVRIILSAMLVAGVLMYGFLAVGLIPAIPIEPIALKSALVGGGLLGFGMALLGYCPASCCAAIGQGSRDALFGVLGMMVGTVLFEAVYPSISLWFQDAPIGGTMSTLLAVSPWCIFGLLAIVLLLVDRWAR